MNRLSLFLLINFIILGVISGLFYNNFSSKKCKDCTPCKECDKCKCPECKLCPACPDCSKCEKCQPCPKFDKPVMVSYPTDDNMDKDFIKKYITTIYPMLPQKDYNGDYWKTLDFYYTLNCYTDIYKDANTSFYYPDDKNFRTANPMFANIINSFEENTKTKKLLFKSAKTQYGNNYLGYDMLNKSDFSYIPEIYNLNLLPLCSVGSSNDVEIRKRGIIRGLFVNRYNPDNVFISTAYCTTGTANTELATTNIPGVSLFLIRDGFKSNSIIEISHCDTNSQSSNISNMNFNTKTSKYGHWIYYTRGSGIFYNLGKTDFAYNKVHALLKLNNFENSMEGYQKLVKLYGTDDDKNKKCNKDNSVQPYDFKDISYNECCTLGHSTTDQIWCTNDVLLNHLFCCKNCPNVCSGTDDISRPCQECLFPSYRTWDWRAFLPIIPEKYKTEEEQLAWVLYGSVNSTKEFNSRAKKEDYDLYNKQLLQFSNLGGNADGQLQILVKKNNLDSFQLTTQCNINGSYSIEIFTYNLDYDDSGQQAQSIMMKNLFTANPIGDDKVQCTVIPNPRDPTKQSNLMKCGVLTWAEPYSLPMWSVGNQPLEIMKCPNDLETIKCEDQIIGCPGGNLYDKVDGDCQKDCQKNCNNIMYNPNNSILSASCMNPDGHYVDGTLDLTYCDGQVNSCDGILYCGDCPVIYCGSKDSPDCPPGDFYDSCQDIEYHLLSKRLFANCTNSSGDNNYTNLSLEDCKQDISNCDGNLNCGEC